MGALDDLRRVTTGTITTLLLKRAKLPGLYPMNEETRRRYEAWRKK